MLVRRASPRLGDLSLGLCSIAWCPTAKRALHRDDREANPAEEAAANDPTAGLWGAEEVERQIVCVAGRIGRGWACYPSTSGT